MVWFSEVETLDAIKNDKSLLKKAISQVTPEILGSIIDLSELRPTARFHDVRKLCETAHKIGSRVCVHGGRVAYAASFVRDCCPHVRGIAAVIDFPFGAGTTEAKVASAYSVLAAGAEEVDMVLNIGALLDGKEEFVESEITAVAEVVKREELKTGSPRVLKVIQENCSLTPGIATFRSTGIIGYVAEKTGVHIFAKTSTGFGVPFIEGGVTGACLEDVWFMARIAENTRRGDLGAGRQECRMGVKASGGIRDAKTAIKMMLAGGCFKNDLSLKENLPDIFRIGTSAGFEIVDEFVGLKALL